MGLQKTTGNDFNLKTRQGISDIFFRALIIIVFHKQLLTVLAYLKKLNEKQIKEYKNVIWDTSVKEFNTKDNDNAATQDAVRNYSLSTINIIKKVFTSYPPYIIKGVPPSLPYK